MPTFSIVVPVYNAREYVTEALESVARQAFQDFEVIVIDDGSTDGSGIVAEEFCRQDSRFRYVKQANGGLSAARNAGIELASGEYLYYLDSDDRIPPHTLSACKAEFGRTGADVVLFDAEVFPTSSPMHEHFENYYKRPRISGPVSSDQFVLESLRQRRYFVSACCYVTKRAVVDTLRFRVGMIYEDNLFFLALLLNQRRLVAVLNQDLFQRRLRPSSIMFSEKTIRNYNSMSQLLYAVSGLPFAALSPEDRDEVRTEIIGGILSSLFMFSADIGASPILRARNVFAAVIAALRVSPRFLAPERVLYALQPARLHKQAPSRVAEVSS